MKTKYLVVSIVLVSLISIGSSCEKGPASKKKSDFADPFDGKLKETQITNNALRDDNPKISGDGQTIVYFKDTDDDFYPDSIGVANPKGEVKVIKIQGTLMPEKSGVDLDSLDISRNGKKVAFVGVPFVENWWSVNPIPAYVYVLDLESESLAKIDPQELPEKVYPEEYDAERADSVRVALSDDGSIVAFTVDVWGVDFGEIHNVKDDDMLLIASSDGSSEPVVLMKGIHNAHVDMDSKGRIFYCKTDNEDYSKFELSVINSDGSGNRELGINLTYSGFWGLVVSNNGRVAALNRDTKAMFVADADGNVLAQTDLYYGSVAITGDGSRVLGYQGSTKVPEEERGLVYYNVNDNFSVEQVTEHRGYNINSPFFDVSDSGGIISLQIKDEENEKDSEISSIYWKK